MVVRTGPRSADRTRSLILDYIRAAGRISRVELAQRSRFTEATISNVVRKLIADGLVVETGFSESTGGKRRTLVEIDRLSRYALGVSLDHDRMTYVLADLSGRLVLSSHGEGTGEVPPDEVIPRIAAEIHALYTKAGVDPSSIVGIGVAAPGPLDCALGVLRGRQPTPEWQGFPLEERLESHSGLRVVLDNDATCAALGEHWTTQQWPATPIAATIYMADGIGCGILIEGRAFHGASSNAGEVGHITLDLEGPICHCGSRGCVEMYASPAAVVRRVRLDEGLVADLGLDTVGATTRAQFDLVATAASRGHAASVDAISRAATYLGQGIVTLANILDLDEVHLSGPGFSIAGDIYADVIQRQLDGGTFMRGIHSVRVTLSRRGTEAAALGAAALILQQVVTPHAAVDSRRQAGSLGAAS